MPDEPRIAINGQLLTEGQAMTVRVAIEAFASSLTTDGLGDDTHGRSMTRGYLARIEEIRKMISGAAHDDFIEVRDRAMERITGSECWRPAHITGRRGVYMTARPITGKLGDGSDVSLLLVEEEGNSWRKPKSPDPTLAKLSRSEFGR